ncbi:signal peptide peptidase SppA [Tahibacter caeni]|uniref:signal peptide peptidase SppA n=1 Tax=Tahibacter caeni TaxID=1453545 RepID=UPI0021484B52|nr:signal peptide peptidase SppA [Tahibacter caeni]
MTERKPGPVRRFFGAIWDAINFARRLVLNLIFLFIVLIFLIALSAKAPVVEPRTALVLELKGELVEQFRTDAGSRALERMLGSKSGEIQLRDVLDVIRRAGADPNIERIVLRTDELRGAGLASLTEIGAALERFRATGKDVVAVSDGMTQMPYFLAAHADQILMHPDGAILLNGFASYRGYYKDLLDKLAVQVHLFRVGEFKSAAEPYILNGASREAREADRYWLDGLWQTWLSEVGSRRKLEPQAIQNGIEILPEAIESAQGDLAKIALTSHLVDQLATRDQAREVLIAKGVPDKDKHSFRQVDWRDYQALARHAALPDLRASVAVVVAEGEIVGGEQNPGTVGGESTAALLREAREDDNVKAVVLRVNSPGGEVFASEQIRREIELIKQAGKPVIASMGDVAASGGYWISMDADEIFAQPATITGSIGIFGLFVSIPETLQKIGVHTDGVGTTPLAGALDPRLPLDPSVAKVIQAVIDKGYRDFVGRVAAARGKQAQEIDEVARGRVWSGRQALDRGLVDKLGGLDDAVAAAAERAKLGADWQTRYIEKSPGAFEQFLLNLSDSASARALARIELLRPETSLLHDADLQRPLRLLRTVQNGKPNVFAYCFCEIR